MKLVPEKTSVPGRRRNDLHPDGQGDCAGASTRGLDGELELALSHAFELLSFRTDGEVEGYPAGPGPNIGRVCNCHVKMSALGEEVQ